MTPLKMALLSLSRNRFATLITVIAIAMSVACGGILIRLNQLSESRFSAMGQGGDAIVGAKAGGIEILLGSLNGEGKFPDFLPYKLFETLRSEQTIKFEDGATSKSSYIESVTPFVYFAKYKEYRVTGTDDTFLQLRTSRPAFQIQGKWFGPKDEVVLGSTVASSENVQIGDHIKVQTWFGEDSVSSDFELKVTGILKSTQSQWDRTLFTSVEEAQSVFAQNQLVLKDKSIWGPNVLHYFLVRLMPGGFIPLENLINKRTVGQLVRIEEQKERLKDLSGAGKSLGLFVTAFVILLGGLAVCSMLVTRFDGMSLQLAVLRALGYTKKEISKWLIWEGLLLGLMGSFLGALIDGFSLPLIRNLLGSALPPPDLVSSSIFGSAIIWLIAILATVAAVSVPVFRMSRQDTHSALKN